MSCPSVSYVDAVHNKTALLHNTVALKKKMYFQRVDFEIINCLCILHIVHNDGHLPHSSHRDRWGGFLLLYNLMQVL